jgi:hypothetical protein
MSVPSAQRTPPSAEVRREVPRDEGSGWVTFAGIMLAILGAMNVVYGIAAIDDSTVYVGDAKYVFSDLKTWGWFLLVVGAIQLVGALGIWNRTTWGRWIGIASASANALLQLLFLPALPLLALALLALDVLVIYGLIAYGGRRRLV